MEKEIRETLEQLEDLKHDRESFLQQEKEHDKIYKRDIQAIEKAVDYIRNSARINGSKSDLSAMLLSAVRYALGRRTHIVEWTCEFIVNNRHLLTEEDKHIMIKNIKETKYYGDECDKQEWLRLLAILESEKKVEN